MKAIVTDYDYTLSEKFLTVELFFLLEEKGLIKNYIKDYIKLRKEYSEGKKTYNEFVSEDMSLIKRSLKGLSYLDVFKVIKENLDVEKNMFDWSKEIRNIFPSDEWIFVVVSSTMDLCLEKVQDILDFDTYFCSSYEVKEGRFTGEFRKVVQGSQKGTYVRELSKNLDSVIVIGDAPGDFEMMKYASSSYFFEPNTHTLEELKKQSFDYSVVNRENILSFLEKEV